MSGKCPEAIFDPFGHFDQGGYFALLSYCAPPPPQQQFLCAAAAAWLSRLHLGWQPRSLARSARLSRRKEGGISSFRLSSDFVHCDLQTASFVRFMHAAVGAAGAPAPKRCANFRNGSIYGHDFICAGVEPRTTAEWASIGGGDATLLRMRNRGFWQEAGAALIRLPPPLSRPRIPLSNRTCMWQSGGGYLSACP